MEKKTLSLFSFIFIILITSCGTKTEDPEVTDIQNNRDSVQYSEIHNSQNSLDWQGEYRGILPCTDCIGIETYLKLSGNNLYELKQIYIGKSDSVYTYQGEFIWSEENKNIIILNKIYENEIATKYFVGEDQIFKLDMNGNRISGELADKYILKKMKLSGETISAASLTETYWKLKKLFGKEIKMSEMQKREAFMILRKGETKVNGFGSCNYFNGSYELKEGNRIKFSKVAATLMSCLDMQVESQFFKALETADNYSVYGDTLYLNKAKMAPLLIFEAVYLR